MTANDDAPFVADQYRYLGTNENMRVRADQEDFNNAVTAQDVRITPWREIP